MTSVCPPMHPMPLWSGLEKARSTPPRLACSPSDRASSAIVARCPARVTRSRAQNPLPLPLPPPFSRWRGTDAHHGTLLLIEYLSTRSTKPSRCIYSLKGLASDTFHRCEWSHHRIQRGKTMHGVFQKTFIDRSSSISRLGCDMRPDEGISDATLS